MRLQHKILSIGVLIAILLAAAIFVTPVAAQKPELAPPSVSAPVKPKTIEKKAAKAKAAKKRIIPDYGGRDSNIESALDQTGTASAIDPLAQAGRAFEALIVVLALVVGGLFLLRKSGLIKSGNGEAQEPNSAPWSFLAPRPRPASEVSSGAGATTELLSTIASQTLPQSGGARLHLVSVGNRLLLIGATAQSVTLLTEVAQIDDITDETAGPSSVETLDDSTAFASYLDRIGLQSGPDVVRKTTESNIVDATSRLQSLIRSHSDDGPPNS